MLSEIHDPLAVRRVALDMCAHSTTLRGHRSDEAAAAFISLTALQLGRVDINPRSLALQFDLRSFRIRKLCNIIVRANSIASPHGAIGPVISTALARLEIPEGEESRILADAMRVLVDLDEKYSSHSPITKAARATYAACQMNNRERSERAVCTAFDIPNSRSAFRKIETGGS